MGQFATKLRDAVNREITAGLLTVPNVFTESPSTSGELTLTRFLVDRAREINTIRTWTGGTEAATGTHGFVGLYTFNGTTTFTRVATSADTATLWSAEFTTYNTKLTARYQATEGSYLYFATLFTGGTAPALPDAGGWYARNFEPADGGPLSAYIGAQTSLPASILLSNCGPTSRRYIACMMNDPAWS
jgi:hypothetical protein